MKAVRRLYQWIIGTIINNIVIIIIIIIIIMIIIMIIIITIARKSKTTVTVQSANHNMFIVSFPELARPRLFPRLCAAVQS